MHTIRFLRLLGVDDKAAGLRAATREGPGKDSRVDYSRTARELSAVPLTPFAYWLDEGIRGLFESNVPTRNHVETRCGMSTLDDFRFLRLNWEVPVGSRDWVRYAKGESSRPYVDDARYYLNWGNKGFELKAYVEAKVGSASRKIQSESHYWRPGATWVRRTHRLCMRAMPEGFVFSGGAQAAFPAPDSDTARLAFLALANSAAFDALIKVSVGRTGDAVQFESGMIDRSPWPSVNTLPEALGDLAARAWDLCRYPLVVHEPSVHFGLPEALMVAGSTFAERSQAAMTSRALRAAELRQVQAQIDDSCFALYGISEQQQRAITDQLQLTHDDTAESSSSVDQELDALIPSIDPARLASSLISWAVGVAFGRFDVRLALGLRPLPEVPDPYRPLPEFSAGTLPSKGGVPIVPDEYPLEVPSVLVDDPGHGEDIVARTHAVCEIVFGTESDSCWGEIVSLLGRKDEGIRWWMRRRFFDYHLSSYSVERSRKAPIYWPLGTTSGSYLVWLYAHRVTGDSLFRLLSDVVSPKLALERRRLSELVQEADPSPSASQRKAIDGQEKLLGELQEFVDELTAVAPLWHPHLNDGIVVVLAPLWRLFGHHKPWSKELRGHWDSLVAGEYDWAQLAMHLWPERVVPKCAEDRSLAIAHGLEDVFWIQDDDKPDKWRHRQNPTVSVVQLIADRTDPAAKAALEDVVR